MSCLREALRELRMVQRAAPPEPELDPDLRRDPVFRAGYISGFAAALRDAIDIIRETCEIDDDEDEG